MARKLNDSMSSEVHINNALRHTRRCKQTQGAEKLVSNISPLIKELDEKRISTKEQKLLRDNAYDDLIFDEGALNDIIRNISDTIKQFDRSNPGRPVHKLLFPEGGYSSIIRSSHAKKVDISEQIIERIKSLGSEHSLAAQITPLTEGVAKVRASISNLQLENTKVRTAVANEEVAQANLRKQYEFNYLDAIKMFGKTFANRLFPQTVSKKKLEEEIATNET